MVFDESFLLHAFYESICKKAGHFMGIGLPLFSVEPPECLLCPLAVSSVGNFANFTENTLLFFSFHSGVSLGRAPRAAAILVSVFTCCWNFGAQYRNFFASSALFRKFDLKFGDFFVLAA